MRLHAWIDINFLITTVRNCDHTISVIYMLACMHACVRAEDRSTKARKFSTRTL